MIAGWGEKPKLVRSKMKVAAVTAEVRMLLLEMAKAMLPT